MTSLEDLGLGLYAVVRFRRTDTGRWREGRVRRMNNDGSVEIIDNKTGSIRSIRPSMVERRTKGPRGGVFWEPVTRRERESGR
jgi:hypothetical protein